MREFWDQRAETAWTDVTWEALPLLDLCGDVEGRDVLELGCGSAALGRTLALKGARVIAVDFSAPMIEVARALPGGELVEFVCADVLTLDLGRQFDLIVGAMFLHETPEAEFPRLVASLDRHLAPGGRIIFLENSFFNPAFRFVRRHLVDHGVLRKVGSHDETPFDPQRFRILQETFPRARRRVDRFVLFSRGMAQFLGHRRGFGWTREVGLWLDKLIGHISPENRLALAWSYDQFILAER